jgi:hypothetical protein
MATFGGDANYLSNTIGIRRVLSSFDPDARLPTLEVKYSLINTEGS